MGTKLETTGHPFSDGIYILTAAFCILCFAKDKQLLASEYRHRGADRHAIVQIDDMLVQHPDTTVRNGSTDGFRGGSAMDPVEGVTAVLEKIQRTCSERVRRTARLNVVRILELAVGAGIALDHLLRRPPGRPFLLDLDDGVAGEFEPGAADADTLTDRAARGRDVIEKMRTRQDQDLLGLKLALDPYLLRPIPRLDLESIGRSRGGKRGPGGSGGDEFAAGDHGQDSISPVTFQSF